MVQFPKRKHKNMYLLECGTIIRQASTTGRVGRVADDEGVGIDDVQVADAEDAEVMGVGLEHGSCKNGVKVA